MSDEGPHFVDMKYLDTFFGFKEHKTDGEILTFSWTPGDMDAACRLKKQEDGTYAGKCQCKGSGKSLELVIIPPQNED